MSSNINRHLSLSLPANEKSPSLTYIARSTVQKVCGEKIALCDVIERTDTSLPGVGSAL